MGRSKGSTDLVPVLIGTTQGIGPAELSPIKLGGCQVEFRGRRTRVVATFIQERLEVYVESPSANGQLFLCIGKDNVKVRCDLKKLAIPSSLFSL